MNSLGLVIRDDQTFLSKVVNAGMDEDIFTRDRADEIIRISVAMSNKYVLDKEIDFRSEDELAKVQETILKLVGIGLEIKCQRNVEEGVQLLMDASPVSLFRVAYTRIEKLRNRWRKLLLNHRIEIFVSSEEFKCLDDLTCRRLSEMSIFNEREIYAIRSLILEDELFDTLDTLEYYESELERYEFILELKELLPFKMLNRSPHVRAENLAEIDSMREALINTLVISACVDGKDPVSVSIHDVRDFLSRLDKIDGTESIPEDMDDTIVEIIGELGTGMDEAKIHLLTREIIQTFQSLLDTVSREWETVTSASETVFFKRWSRMLVCSDMPDSLDRILSTPGLFDEFDLEILIDQLLNRPEDEAKTIIERIQWDRLVPNQLLRLFQHVQAHQALLARRVNFVGFSALDLIDFLEGVDQEIIPLLKPALSEVLPRTKFSLEEMASLSEIHHLGEMNVLKSFAVPEDLDVNRVVHEFREGNAKGRKLLFCACLGSSLFHDLFVEAWSTNPEFVKQFVKQIPPSDIGNFFFQACDRCKPRVMIHGKIEDAQVDFGSDALNSLYKSLPKSKKRAAVQYFGENSVPDGHQRGPGNS
jgi:hypothetical protein